MMYKVIPVLILAGALGVNVWGLRHRTWQRYMLWGLIGALAGVVYAFVSNGWFLVAECCFALCSGFQAFDDV